MADERRLLIPAILDRVPEAYYFVAGAAEAAGLDERGVYQCQMATDEWCTNIAEHGFEGRGQHGKIEIICTIRPRQLTVSITDDGPAFNPTTLPEPDPKKPLEDREPGGLGWFFIRKLMDDVDYEFKNGRNHLTMIKNGVPDEPSGQRAPESPFPVQAFGEGIWVVAPSGRLDSSVGRQLEAALLAQIDAGRIRLVIDLKDVIYISSTGLKALITNLRRAQERGGLITLARLTTRVLEVFQMSGFDTLFTITSSVEEAARATDRSGSSAQ